MSADGPEAKARVGGDITYQVGFMGLGAKYLTPKFEAPKNDFLGRTMKGELAMGPIESKVYDVNTFIRSYKVLKSSSIS